MFLVTLFSYYFVNYFYIYCLQAWKYVCYDDIFKALKYYRALKGVITNDTANKMVLMYKHGS